MVVLRFAAEAALESAWLGLVYREVSKVWNMTAKSDEKLESIRLTRQESRAPPLVSMCLLLQQSGPRSLAEGGQYGILCTWRKGCSLDSGLVDSNT